MGIKVGNHNRIVLSASATNPNPTPPSTSTSTSTSAIAKRSYASSSEGDHTSKRPKN